MKNVFINGQGVVVQAISGPLSSEDLALFLRDYAKIFSAEKVIAVDESTSLWIGGSYDATSGVFSPPPQPEQIVEETTNDDAPIE